MAHFAQIDDGGFVVQVVVVTNDDAPNEQAGQAFIAETLGLPGFWVQTSYNDNFRKQYAGIGYRYDADADVFIAPQPFPSWTLDANHDWEAPTPMPSEADAVWSWNEDLLVWEEMTPAGMPESLVDDWLIEVLSA